MSNRYVLPPSGLKSARAFLTHSPVLFFLFLGSVWGCKLVCIVASSVFISPCQRPLSTSTTSSVRIWQTCQLTRSRLVDSFTNTKYRFVQHPNVSQVLLYSSRLCHDDDPTRRCGIVAVLTTCLIVAQALIVFECVWSPFVR
jgi:hypothetical protein